MNISLTSLLYCLWVGTTLSFHINNILYNNNNNPDVNASYISFESLQRSSHNDGIMSLRFRFKTDAKSGDLMTSYNKREDQVIMVSLSGGQVKVECKHSSGKPKKWFHIGGDYNDMTWHAVKIVVRHRDVTVDVDGHNKTISFYESDPERFYLDSRVYFGNNPTKFGGGKGFTGCIEEISYPIGSTQQRNFEKRGHIDDVCRDKCTVNDKSLCRYGSRCVKRFKGKATCDCFGTGKKGYQCDKEDPVATFNGQTTISFPSESLLKRRKNEVKFRFKTHKQSGVIIHSGESNEYLVAEIYQGNLYVKVALKSEEVVLNAGNNALHDGMWHSVKVTRAGKTLTLDIDRGSYESSVNFKQHPSDEYCEQTIKLKTIVGGYPYSRSLMMSFSKRNFEGCLQQVYFNKHGTEVIALSMSEHKQVLVEGLLRYGSCQVRRKTVEAVKTEAALDNLPTSRNHLLSRDKTRLSQTTVAWITGGICVGSIALIFTLACGFHLLRKRYSGQFLAKQRGKPYFREASKDSYAREAKDLYLQSPHHHHHQQAYIPSYSLKRPTGVVV